jgi:hypothetical protein
MRGGNAMMKSLVIFISVLFFSTACTGADMMIKKGGTVRYISLEGGFYGIVGDDGKNYDPVNLPSGFQEDQLKVKFEGRILKDQVSFHMWGEIIEIESIVKEE